MTNSILIVTAEVAQTLSVSKTFTYKLVRELNEELKTKGFITVAGKVSRKFFEEKVYGIARKSQIKVSTISLTARHRVK